MTKKELYVVLDKFYDNTEIKIVPPGMRSIAKPSKCYSIDRIEFRKKCILLIVKQN